MSKYDTAINSTNTVGLSCGVWSVIYSWIQSVDWVAVGSFLGMVIAYLINIYFNIQRRRDDKEKNNRLIEIEREKAQDELKLQNEMAQKDFELKQKTAERKLSIELDILKQQLQNEKEKNKQLQNEREKTNAELLNIAFSRSDENEKRKTD